MSVLQNDWSNLLDEEFKSSYYLKLREFLIREYETKTIYPDKFDIFNALHFAPFSEVKVVILGQDPYHGPNQAHGLSFSVQKRVAFPPSLQNIFKELRDDLGYSIPNHGCLESWAKQGVLLLNAVLTVCAGMPNSHKGKGWEQFTDRIIKFLNERDAEVVFILWGKNAQEKERLITSKKHLIIKSAHPSPLSAGRGFFGSKPFSRTNNFLKINGSKEIDWQIPDM